MEVRNHKNKRAYQSRLEKEKSISEDDIQRRMCWDMPILAQNHKCQISLDMPVHNCQPSKVCANVCYASQGRQLYRQAVVKSLAISRMIEEDPARAARKIVDEAEGHPIRLAGSGDILPSHKQLLDFIEEFGGSWWGFTRRIDTHKLLPRLMYSFDVSSPKAPFDYVQESVPVARRAYLRRPEDPEPTLNVAVVFPVHGPRTNYVNKVPEGDYDCPAVRGSVDGCAQCQRCF